MSTYKDRAQQKRTTVSGKKPTIPATNDHSDGTWLDTDIYIGELYINMADKIVYTRTHNDEIIGFPSSQVTMVDSMDDLTNLPDPAFLQKVSVREDGSEHVSLNNGLGGQAWFRQGQTSFVIENDSIEGAWLEGLSLDRVMLITERNGDLTLKDDVTKADVGDTAIICGEDGKYDGIKVRIIII